MPSMPTLIFGEVLLVELPFHERAGAKLRPVIAVLDTADDDVVVLPVTSRPSRSRFDFILVEWKAAGLALASIARVDKIAVISKSSIRRELGHLADSDSLLLAREICSVFCPPVAP